MTTSSISPSSEDAEALSTADGQFLEQNFPDIARAMGADSVTRLRERTCAGDTASGPTAASNTSWVAHAEVVVSDVAVARQVAEHVRAQAEKQGWTTSQDPAEVGDRGSFAGQRLLSAKLDDPDLVMTVLLDDDRDGALVVATIVRGICRDMPQGHRMVHSRLDPEYGRNLGGGYEETGSLDDATGRAKPLPASTQSPAPSGPAGASPRGVFTG